MGYVTFVGVPLSATRNMRMPVSEISLEITSSLQRNTEQFAVLAGTAMTFDLTNMTGSSGEFDIYFYRVGTPRTSGDTETLRIINGEIQRTGLFRCGAEPGQYRLEIAAGNRTLLEYTFDVEE
jgi:hypothetical protein